MAETGSRHFYGGEPLTGAGGEISAGKYAGPEAQVHAPWTCPACATENLGRLELGCSHCGSGKPGYHVDTPPAPATEPYPHKGLSTAVAGALEDLVGVAYVHWLQQTATTDRSILATDNEKFTEAAFRAGWVAGAQNQARQTMQAAPVTADVPELAPEGKPRRTIIAALELFKDQVLQQAEAEIASGEWCSVAEVEDLLRAFRRGLE